MHILYLEDEPKDAELVHASLEAEGFVCDLTRTDNQADFRRFLQQGGFDLILADYTLPLFDGMSALKLAHETCPQVPFIFVSGTMGEELAIEALKQGATDYVLKTRLSRIAPSVRRALREAEERSHRERAERALQRNEAYLAEAQRLSQTGSFGWHVASGKIYWSQETYRIFGVEQSTQPTLDLVLRRIHPDDKQVVQEIIDFSTQQAKEFDFEHRLLMHDGSVKYLRVVGHPSTHAESSDLEFVGAVTDITKRKQAEQKFSGLLESAPDAMIVMNHEGKIVLVNAQVEKLFGYPREQLLQQPVEILIPKRFQSQHSNYRNGYFTQPRARSMGEDRQLYGRRKDGTEFPVEISLSPLETEEGIVVSAAVRDITARKRAEEELQQLVDLIPQIIVVLDADGKQIHANRVAREYSGMSLKELLSDLIGRVVHPDDAKRMRGIRERGFASSVPFELEARLMGKDGIYRWFLFRYNPFVEEGRARRWYVSATEIESRKREEDRVRKENVRLEERTRIAQELHDTLLQTFLSASMLLSVAADDVSSDSSVKPQLDRILQIMNQGIQEGRATIQDLRSAGTPDLVQALSHVQEEVAVQPDVDFRVVVVGRQEQLRPPIWHEIYRIGREALVNAFSHSRAQRVEFELEYADSNLRMRVRDNGRGIDPRVLQAGRDGHWGLAGMRERAAKIGGLLNISSSATAGTEVQLSIPGRIAFEPSPSARRSQQ